METKTFEAPALFADHHVTEVRRILLELGVEDVYASSAFQIIEVTFDPAKVGAGAIETCLQEAGYLGEVAMLLEAGVAVEKKSIDDSAFRHTATYETVKSTVSFAQRVEYAGRPLWPCPGMGPVKAVDD